MITRTEIVTQLVAGMISAGKGGDLFDMVDHCVDIANYIIQATTEEIPFPESVI